MPLGVFFFLDLHCTTIHKYSHCILSVLSGTDFLPPSRGEIDWLAPILAISAFLLVMGLFMGMFYMVCRQSSAPIINVS
jgi:hypothetical protein